MLLKTSGGYCPIPLPPVEGLVMNSDVKNEDSAKSDCFCDLLVFL